MECTVEVFGSLRQLLGASEVRLVLPAGATGKDVLAAIVDREPRFLGKVVADDRQALVWPYRLYRSGSGFTDDIGLSVVQGDLFSILPVSVGG